MKLRKYEFSTEAAATTKINALGVDAEGSPTHSHSIVRLGNIVTTPGEYDFDDNVITAPEYSSNYHVDVLWNGEPESDWDAEMVWCKPFGVHAFGSSSANAEYIEKCKELHPDWFPDPQPEEE